MSLYRSLSASLLSAATTFSIVTASGCGTSAIAVDDCRSIEYARCDAGVPCGLVSDAAACKRYSRDHCLHGLLAKPPGGAVGECVRVIREAGQCAAEDPEATLSDCAVTEPRSGLDSACDVVAYPEKADECSFLLTQPPDDTSGGGQPATGGTGSDEPAGGTSASGEEPSAGTGGQPE